MSEAEARRPLAELLAGANARARASSLVAAAESHSLFRNSVLIMLATGASSALGYVFWLIVARSYPAAEVGVAAALIASMMLIAAIAELGTSRSLVQKLPRQTRPEDWSRTLSATVMMGSAAGFAIALVAALLVLPALSPQLDVIGASAGHALLFAGGVALWCLAQMVDHVFIAEREAGKMVLRNVTLDAAKIPIVVVAGALLGRGSVEIFGSWALALAVSLAFAFVLLFPRLTRRYRPVLHGTAREARMLLSTYAGNYVITLAGVLPAFLLPLLVLERLSATQSAHFYVAWLLGGAFFTISIAVSMALFAEGSHDPKRIPEQTRSAARIIGALITPLIALFAVAGGLILGLFGEDYESEGGALLLLLTASAIPDAVVSIFVARMRAEERLRVPAILNMCLATITLVGAWLLMPSMELAGVGVAWIVARLSGCAFVAGYAVARRRGTLAPAGVGRE